MKKKYTMQIPPPSRGFRLSTIRKFAGRSPRNRDATTRQLAAAHTEK
jgi:hypothetical protein